MGKPTGFLEVEREDRHYDKPAARVTNWHEFLQPLPELDVEYVHIEFETHDVIIAEGTPSESTARNPG